MNPSQGAWDNPILRFELRRRRFLSWVMCALSCALAVAFLGTTIFEYIDRGLVRTWRVKKCVGVACMLVIALNGLAGPALVSAALLEELDHGTGPGLILAPIPRAKILIGKLVPAVLPLAVQSGFFLFVVVPVSLWLGSTDPLGWMGDLWASVGLAGVGVVWSGICPSVCAAWGCAKSRSLPTNLVLSYGLACAFAVLSLSPAICCFAWSFPSSWASSSLGCLLSAVLCIGLSVVGLQAAAASLDQLYSNDE